VKCFGWVTSVTLSFLLAALPRISLAQNFFHIVPQDLKMNEIQPIQSFLQTAEKILPAKLKKEFPQGIRVQFSLTGQAHGKAISKSKAPLIAINKNLIKAIEAGEVNSLPALDEKGNLRIHKTVYREALATVLHETAHLYDFLNIQSNSMKEKIGFCLLVDRDDRQMKQECEIYKGIKTTISTSPYYKEVAGWMVISNGSGDRAQENMMRFRSPDPYELTNPIEHFAVNFEYFLLDPQYSCKRPSLAHLFSRYFELPLSSNCKANLKYVDPEATDIDSTTKKINYLFKEIPLDRVYQIHYLVAEGGSNAMSKFGHAMLRLVICAQGVQMGPECIKNTPESLVLSFRAFVNTPQINTLAGLTGRYPSRLFVVPLDGVIQEYNETEYRGLKSYPLNLTRREIRSVVERALETHWSYDNQYYFVTNNCAVETLNLLRSSLLRPELMAKTVIYPLDLLRVLLQEKLAMPIPENTQTALEQGYYFDSSEIKHLQSYSRLFNKKAGTDELKEFFKLPTEKRRELYLKRFSEMKRPLDETYQASAYQLENYMAVRERSEFYAQVTSEIWNSDRKQKVSLIMDLNLTEIYRRAVEAFGALSAPYQILKFSEYGIPTNQEIMESEIELSNVRAQIQEGRAAQEKVKNDLQKNEKYQEILKINSLIGEIFNLE
jgi:hypothetical protein